MQEQDRTAEAIVKRIATLVIVGTMLMSAMEPAASRPPIPEMNRVELSRVLTLPRLQSMFPSYRDILDASLAREIVCEPWEARMPTAEVVHMLATRMAAQYGFPSKRFLDELEYQAIRTDPVVYALLRRGLTPAVDADTMAGLIRASCDELGCRFEDVASGAVDMYEQVWMQLAN